MMEQPKFSNQHVTIADWLCAALVLLLAVVGMFAFGVIETLIYFEWPIPCGYLGLPCS